MLVRTQQAALVVMPFAPRPEGQARWWVRLLLDKAGKRRMVNTLGRKTFRIGLATHGLKPSRDAGVVRSRDHRHEFMARMADIPRGRIA